MLPQWILSFSTGVLAVSIQFLHVPVRIVEGAGVLTLFRA